MYRKSDSPKLFLKRELLPCFDRFRCARNVYRQTCECFSWTKAILCSGCLFAKKRKARGELHFRFDADRNYVTRKVFGRLFVDQPEKGHSRCSGSKSICSRNLVSFAQCFSQSWCSHYIAKQSRLPSTHKLKDSDKRWNFFRLFPLEFE